MEVGGLFFDFESLEDVAAVAACQRERGRGDGVFETASPRSPRRPLHDHPRVYTPHECTETVSRRRSWSGWECVYFAFVSVSTVGLGDYALEKPGIGASLIVVLGCASWAVTLGLVQDTISEREYVLATLRDRLRDMRSRLFEFMRRLRDDVSRRRRHGWERAPPDTPGVVMSPLPRMMTNPIHAAPAPPPPEDGAFEDVALDDAPVQEDVV